MALKLWAEFFEDLQFVRGRSLNTVMAYRRDLELYEEFKATQRELGAFFDFMNHRKLSTRSQARVISSLRTYFRYLERNGEKAPELRELKPPRVTASLPKPITVDQFHKLFAACRVEDVHRSARNQITLLLLFGLGCRVSELVGLDLLDFNATDAWLKVVGKGGKERLVPLSENLLQETKTYIKQVRPHLIKDDSRSILINDRGHRPSRVDVWRWLAAWSARAGFDDRSVRTSSATAARRRCWKTAPTCGRSRSCSGTRRFKRRKFTRASPRRSCATRSIAITRCRACRRRPKKT